MGTETPQAPLDEPTYKAAALHRQAGWLVSPLAGVRHRCPGFPGRLRLALLQQLDRMLVWRTDEGHDAVARRPVDGDPALLQLLAGRIDVIDLVGEVPEVPRLAVVLGVPVEGQLDTRGIPPAASSGAARNTRVYLFLSSTLRRTSWRPSRST